MRINQQLRFEPDTRRQPQNSTTRLANMTGTSIRKYRVSVVAMAALLLAGATSYAVAQQRTANADARLQELADNAALAGVNALAATAGQTDAKRFEAANVAVKKAIASYPEIQPIISPSIDGLTTSVALTTSNTGRGHAVTATARYVQPGVAMSPGQSAEAFAKKRTRG
jgi:hypothetical protein